MKTKYFILIIALIICLISILSIYSSNYQKDAEPWKSIYQRQIIWVLIGLLFFFLASGFNYRRLWDVVYIFYAAVLLLLFLVFILGIVRLGAQRWLKFAWFNFQPSEVAKLVMAVFLAKYYSKKSLYDISSPVKNFGLWKAFILPFLFVAIPVGLIIEQPDLGSGLLVIFLFLTIIFLAEVKIRYLVMLITLALLAMPILWHFLRDYQKDRLMVFINPNIDPLGAGYTVIQSKIAIGSGWIFGKGWLSGTQSQLHFLPEAHTDFIFSSFAEEWGLFGCVILLGLYYLLIRQGLAIALKTRDDFGRLLAMGITLMLGIQVCVNIAMNLGLAPIVGVPLPLMSYGGSSMLVTFIALGILANISKERGVF